MLIRVQEAVDIHTGIRVTASKSGGTNLTRPWVNGPSNLLFLIVAIVAAASSLFLDSTLS